MTVLASGGVGGLYKNSTNFKHLTGDALAISLKHDIELKDMSYVQIHPTTLYKENPKERSFLISESVRGEGALLYDKNMNRFVDELQPRDVVAQAILKQMEKMGQTTSGKICVPFRKRIGRTFSKYLGTLS